MTICFFFAGAFVRAPQMMIILTRNFILLLACCRWYWLQMGMLDEHSVVGAINVHITSASVYMLNANAHVITYLYIQTHYARSEK